MSSILIVAANSISTAWATPEPLQDKGVSMHNSIAAPRFTIFVVLLLTATGSAQISTHQLASVPRPGAVNIEKANNRPITEVEASIKEYEALVTASPDDAVILNNLGVMYYLAGRYYEAQSMIRKAAFREPKSFQIRTNWALALNKTHNPAYAISMLENVLNEDPNQHRTRQALCEIYLQEDRKTEAYECYETMRSNGKLGALSAANFSVVMLDRGEVDRAIELLRWADANFPPEAGVKNSLGIALYQKRKYADAERNLQQAVDLEPRRAKVRYNLAIVQMATQKRAAVLEQYKFLKTSNPELAGELYKVIYRDKIVSAAPRL